MNPITVAAVLQVCWAGALGLPVDCGRQPASLAHCPSISQDKLLDRVIQHTELIHGVSEETCSMFEDMFVPLPMRLQRTQAGNTCITKDFPIPTSKSQLQQISDAWLLHSVLMLIQSWIEPLVYLQTTLELYDDVPEMLLNKTKWVSEKLISLEQGVVVLIRKMLDGGVLNSSYDDYSIARMEVQPEVLESILRDYNLLCCFKKDAHKMETILKLLKCRQIDKYNCALY